MVINVSLLLSKYVDFMSVSELQFGSELIQSIDRFVFFIYWYDKKYYASKTVL